MYHTKSIKGQNEISSQNYKETKHAFNMNQEKNKSYISIFI